MPSADAHGTSEALDTRGQQAKTAGDLKPADRLKLLRAKHDDEAEAGSSRLAGLGSGLAPPAEPAQRSPAPVSARFAHLQLAQSPTRLGEQTKQLSPASPPRAASPGSSSPVAVAAPAGKRGKHKQRTEHMGALLAAMRQGSEPVAAPRASDRLAALRQQQPSEQQIANTPEQAAPGQPEAAAAVDVESKMTAAQMEAHQVAGAKKTRQQSATDASKQRREERRAEKNAEQSRSEAEPEPEVEPELP
jgi:hypothetical protein